MSSSLQSMMYNHPGLLLSLIVAVSVLFKLLSAIVRYWRSPYGSPLALVPGPENKHWFFGFLTPAEAGSLQMSPKLLQYCKEFDGVWSASFTNRRPTLVLGDPEAIQYVLNNSETYRRAQAQMRLTRLVFGDGMVGVDGWQHRRQRKIVGPAFSSNAVEEMAPIFYRTTEKLIKSWEMRIAKHRLENEARQIEINAYSDFEALSMDIIGLAGFQYDFGSLEGRRSELEAAFVNVTKSASTGSVYSFLRSHFPFVVKIGKFLSKEQIELDRQKANIHRISKRLVQDAKKRLEKEKGGESRNRDILTLLVRSNLSTDVKERLDEEEIISMVPTFLSGGYDNNASEMSYAIYALTHSMRTQTRLREELTHPPKGCEDWRENLKSLEKLPYLDAVMRETLRLYSSAHSIPRTCTRSDMIPLSKPIQLRDGSWTSTIPIGADDDVVIAQKWMNIDPSIWGSDAYEFRAERWMQDTQHKYYSGGLPSSVMDSKATGWSHLMTFSVGPRNCIGYRMALAEFKVGLALVVSKFEFLCHESMKDVYGEVQIVDRPRVRGRDGYAMPCWLRSVEVAD